MGGDENQVPPFRLMKADGWTFVHEDDKERLDAKLKPIQAEFHEVLVNAAGALGVAVSGLKLTRDKWLDRTADSDPEAHLILANGEPGDPTAVGYARWQVRTLPERLAPDGPVAQQLGQQWAVTIHSQWEHEYRPRLAEAAGVEKNEVAEPLAADVGRMRNDIVHHAGVATRRNCGRLEVLKWFEPGDTILITPALVTEYMSLIGLITLNTQNADWHRHRQPCPLD